MLLARWALRRTPPPPFQLPPQGPSRKTCDDDDRAIGIEGALPDHEVKAVESTEANVDDQEVWRIESKDALCLIEIAGATGLVARSIEQLDDPLERSLVIVDDKNLGQESLFSTHQSIRALL